jgi:RNA polymerase sigma-70 factor, ECF subfamily
MSGSRDDLVVLDHRDRLVGLAYRILGQITEAEDAVQETFVRWSEADRTAIDNPGGWLTTVCTRICLDRLRSAVRRRETYVGPWLPEPVRTDDLDLSDATAMGESLTLAFLVVLEALSPLERVAFLLHDVFGYGHDELASMLERSPAAIRQLVSRARRNVASRRPRFEPDADRRWDIATSFLAAASGGPVDELITLLAPDVVFTSDGGGLVSAARRPVVGAEKVARFVQGLIRQTPADLRVIRTEINGMPGLLALRDGHPDTVIAFSVADGLISAVHAIRNPEKLSTLTSDHHLG